MVLRDELDLGRRRRRTTTTESKEDGRDTTTTFLMVLMPMLELVDKGVLLWKCWRRTLAWLLLDDEVGCWRRVRTTRRRLPTDDDPRRMRTLLSSDSAVDREEGEAK